jgi:hypothetical protein
MLAFVLFVVVSAVTSPHAARQSTPQALVIVQDNLPDVV